MSCNTSCRVCPKLVFVSSVAFTAGNLVLNLPDTQSYEDGERYCFVITTAFPGTTTLNAPVVASTDGGTTLIPVLARCGRTVVSQQIASRRRYPFVVSTTETSGTITITSPLPNVDRATLPALP